MPDSKCCVFAFGRQNIYNYLTHLIGPALGDSKARTKITLMK